jgi:hypothetical protein
MIFLLLLKASCIDLIIEVIKFYEQQLCRIKPGSKSDCSKDFLTFVF